MNYSNKEIKKMSDNTLDTLITTTSKRITEMRNLKFDNQRVSSEYRKLMRLKYEFNLRNPR